MSFLSKLGNVLTGGLSDTIMGTIEKYFPPDMSEQQKSEVSIALKNIELEKSKVVQAAINDAEQSLNERIQQYEGTASDLRTIPVMGPLMIFLRGCQRPLWGYATLYLDWLWFSEWSLSEKQESALIVMNFLVLGFLFGERAIKNVAPMLTTLLEARKA